LLHASFRPRLATTPLRFANPSPPSGWIKDFHLQTTDHARHTLSSAPLRAALRPGNAVAPLEVCQTCLMKECGESKFRSCPGRGAALFTLLRRAGTYLDAARSTPALQRTAARCAASGERCGTAGGLSDVSDEGMRWEHISLVSRTRRSVLHALACRALRPSIPIQCGRAIPSSASRPPAA
jgi:hypothetical protein